MTRDGDFDFDLPFRHAVFTNIEQQNLFKSMTPKKARRAGIDPPQPIFAILNEYMDEKMCRIVKQDPLDALRALHELRRVLHDLVYGIKHPEFKPMLKLIEDTGVSIAMGWCQLLVKRYRDSATPREELPELNALLVGCIENGAWPNWQEDIAQWGKPERGDDDDWAA
jgi:hypothetical protein